MSIEFAKMRGLRIGVLIAVLCTVVAGVICYAGLLTPDFDRATQSSWNALLRGMISGHALVGPLLIAVLASRLVDAEHQGHGWLMSATSGMTPGRLCRAKFCALGLLVGAATVFTSAGAAGIGHLAGIEVPWPQGRWIVATMCVLIVNLTLVALHIVLASRMENQLIGLGMGLLGTVIALLTASLPPWIAHFTPWGFYALSSATRYEAGTLVAADPAVMSLMVLALVTTAVFTVYTRTFDRQER